MRMIFNVGARRSGTYWLQRIVCAHPAVAEVPAETHLFSHGIAPLLERFQHDERGSREVGKVFVDRERLIAAVRWLCDTAFDEFARGGETHVAERTPWHVHHLPLIGEVYPEARFVHIVRDGRDVARSLCAQPWGPGTLAEAAEEWRTAVVAGQAGAAVLGDRVIEIRYEELLAEPRPVIERIHAHLGLEGGIDEALTAAGEVANLGSHDSRVGAGKWRELLGRRDLRAVDRVAGDLLRALGYAQGEGVSAG